MQSRLKRTGGLFHGFSRPASGVLPEARKSVENGALSHIRITRQGRRSGSWSLSLRGRTLLFYENLPAVPVPDGNDCAADQKCFWVAGRAAPHTGYFCIFTKSQIQKTPPKFPGTGKLSDTRALPGIQFA